MHRGKSGAGSKALYFRELNRSNPALVYGVGWEREVTACVVTLCSIYNEISRCNRGRGARGVNSESSHYGDMVLHHDRCV